MKIMRNGVWVEFDPATEREKRLAAQEKRQREESALRDEHRMALERGDYTFAVVCRSLASQCGFQL